MQQRRPRLGDILDDYCPRERRITNHAVVAMIEERVEQTRCTTCDADHEYRQAKVPGTRKKKDPRALSGEAADQPRARKVDGEEDTPQEDPSPEVTNRVPFEMDAADATATVPFDVESGDNEESLALEDDGPVHRPLIRATLPRPEGQAPEWKDPEFTVRQPTSNRGREFGGGAGGGQRPGRNRRPMNAGQTNAQGPMRFGSGGPRDRNARPGHGQGQGQGPKGNRPGGHPGGQRGGRPGQGGDQRGPGRKRGPR
ncbi:MAG: hypothetical protein ABL993_04200 [Vicinamibacterales bacterium]